MDLCIFFRAYFNDFKIKYLGADNKMEKTDDFQPINFRIRALAEKDFVFHDVMR